MNSRTIRPAVLAAGGLLALCLNLRGAETNQPALPKVFLLDARQLAATRQAVQKGDARLMPAFRQLERDARDALKEGPFSVTFKKTTPPSGDKHDYMSQAPYFWPDPHSSNGLPYIRRDGERNPDIGKISDHKSLDQMENAVETLALAYYFKGDEKYAQKAALLLEAWFLAPETRMNPNLQYAQAVLGVNSGRGIGLIETRGLTRVVDAMGLLEGCKALSETERKGIEAWYDKFLTWMQESENGKAESAAKNNHGTFYDVQTASYALFLGKRELARSIVETAEQKRIARQIEPDGKQPLELVRTRAWGYSIGNLSGLMLLARLGDNVGIDLWHFETADGRCIRKALEYLAPFALGEKKWPHQQLGRWPPEMLYPLMREAARKYPETVCSQWIKKIPRLEASSRANLLWPIEAGEVGERE